MVSAIERPQGEKSVEIPATRDATARAAVRGPDT
jgi:hypothetical protein